MFASTNQVYKLVNEPTVNTERITYHQLPAPSATSIDDYFESKIIRTPNIMNQQLSKRIFMIHKGRRASDQDEYSLLNKANELTANTIKFMFQQPPVSNNCNNHSRHQCFFKPKNYEQ